MDREREIFSLTKRVCPRDRPECLPRTNLVMEVTGGQVGIFGASKRRGGWAPTMQSTTLHLLRNKLGGRGVLRRLRFPLVFRGRGTSKKPVCLLEGAVQNLSAVQHLVMAGVPCSTS